MKKKASAEATVRNLRRKTRRRYSAEEKNRIVLEGLRSDHSVAELCRREGIRENLYYRWSKDFLEAGKSRLVGDTKREANSKQVKALRQENEQLPGLSARTGEPATFRLHLAAPARRGVSPNPETEDRQAAVFPVTWRSEVWFR